MELRTWFPQTPNTRGKVTGNRFCSRKNPVSILLMRSFGSFRPDAFEFIFNLLFAFNLLVASIWRLPNRYTYTVIKVIEIQLSNIIIMIFIIATILIITISNNTLIIIYIISYHYHCHQYYFCYPYYHRHQQQQQHAVFNINQVQCPYEKDVNYLHRKSIRYFKVW